MSKVIDLMRWEELQGFLPTIVQDIDTADVLAVTRTTQPVFEELVVRWQLRPFLEDPACCPHPIAQELLVDCDADCLLVKASVNAAQWAQCRAFFCPLGQEIPSTLLQGTRLVLAVAQDANRRDVLMAAFMDEEALKLTLSTRLVHYYSRQRQRIWKKGEESGCVQHLIEGRFDEKVHAVVLTIRQDGGAACHDGYRSCFYRRIREDGELEVVEERIFDPDKVYK